MGLGRRREQPSDIGANPQVCEKVIRFLSFHAIVCSTLGGAALRDSKYAHFRFLPRQPGGSQIFRYYNIAAGKQFA